MNLTGDGFNMVTMSQSLRDKVPPANFFQQLGYERNPVARQVLYFLGFSLTTGRLLAQRRVRFGSLRPSQLGPKPTFVRFGPIGDKLGRGWFVR